MMKKIFLACVFFLGGNVCAQENTMTVILKDGSKVAYDMEQVEKVQMTSPVEESEVADAVEMQTSVLWASHNLGGKTMSDAGGRYTFEEARQNLWEGWRLPTEDEWRELYEKCQWTWTIIDGVPGRLVTSRGKSSIFIPASGFEVDGSSDILVPGAMGVYWSSTVPETIARSVPKATGLYFDSGNIYRIDYPKVNKFSVRLVKDSGKTEHYHNILVIDLNDGNTMSFVINGQLNVSETDSLFRVSSTLLEYNIKKNRVKDYRFEMNIEYNSSISNPKEDDGGSDLRIECLSRGIVKIGGIMEQDIDEVLNDVAVYNIQGQKQNVLVSPETNSILIRLTSLPQGTYIVHVRGVGSLKVNN